MMDLVFDGHDLSTLFDVEPLSYDLPSLDLDERKIPGRNGKLLAGATSAPPELSVRLVSRPGTPGELSALRRELAHILDVDSPRKLQTSEDGDLYRLAMPTGPVHIERYVDTFEAKVEFAFSDPYLRGETRRVPLTSSPTPIRVGGTVAAMPTVAFEATPASRRVGIRLDGGDVIQVATNVKTAVVADCEARTCTANNVAAMITVDSDWFRLEPGTHEIALEVGTFTGDTETNWIEWTELWR